MTLARTRYDDEWGRRLFGSTALAAGAHVAVLALVLLASTRMTALVPPTTVVYTVELTDGPTPGGSMPSLGPKTSARPAAGRSAKVAASVPPPAASQPAAAVVPPVPKPPPAPPSAPPKAASPPKPAPAVEKVKAPAPPKEPAVKLAIPAKPVAEPKPEAKEPPPVARKPDPPAKPAAADEPAPVAKTEPAEKPASVAKAEPVEKPPPAAKVAETAAPAKAPASDVAASGPAESAGEPDTAAADDAYAAAASRWRDRVRGDGGAATGAIGTGGGTGGGGTVVGLAFLAYRQQVVELIKGRWSTAVRRPGLLTRVQFEIAPTGAIGNVRLAHSSGDPIYDETAVRAVQSVERLPPPPPEYADAFRQFMIEFHADDVGGGSG